MQFQFSTATRIVFGTGVSSLAPKEAGRMGRRVFLTTGKSGDRAAKIKESLVREKLLAAEFRVEAEPTVRAVEEATALAKQAGCDTVVAVGGGSAMDAAKAVAAMLNNPGDLFDYLEVVGKAKPISNPSAPCIAVPTTAGTGAEVTKNAVIGFPESKVKVSMRDEKMLPRLALVDPELTLTLAPETTATTGLDALTQLLEAFVSRGANPLTDCLCREGLRRAARSLSQACFEGHDLAARRDMSIASLFGGLALANAKLGAVHGIAAPMGGLLSAPHGAVCAGLLPFVTETNIEVLRRRDPDSKALKRYKELAGILVGKAGATAQNLVDWLKTLCGALPIPSPRSLGLNRKNVDSIAKKAAMSSSMKGNPAELSREEISEILRHALEGF